MNKDIKKFEALIKLAVSQGFNTVGEFNKFLKSHCNK